MTEQSDSSKTLNTLREMIRNNRGNKQHDSVEPRASGGLSKTFEKLAPEEQILLKQSFGLEDEEMVSPEVMAKQRGISLEVLDEEIMSAFLKYIFGEAR